MTDELKAVIKNIEKLGWKRPYRGNYEYWKYGTTNRYIDIGLPYIDLYVYSDGEKFSSYLTVTEMRLFSDLVDILTREKSEGK